MFTVQALNQFAPQPLAGAADFSQGINALGAVVPAFGGDWSGVVPCLDPTESVLAANQRSGPTRTRTACPDRSRPRHPVVSRSSGTA